MKWRNRLVKASGLSVIMAFFINMIVQVNLRKHGLPADEYQFYSCLGSAIVIAVALLSGAIQWKFGNLSLGQKISWLLACVWLLLGLFAWHYAMTTYNLSILLLYAIVSPVIAMFALWLGADDNL